MRCNVCSVNNERASILQHASFFWNMNLESKLYFISEYEWEFWTSGVDTTQRVRHMVDDVRKQLLSLQSQFHLFDQDGEIILDIHTVAEHYHTSGHTAVSISSKGEELLHISNLVACLMHLKQPVRCIVTKVLLDKVVSSRRHFLILLRRFSRRQKLLLLQETVSWTFCLKPGT